jgi:hypothetical protein
MKIQPGLKFGKRVLEAQVRMPEAIKAGSGGASSRANLAHVCGAEAQLDNIRHKSNSIKN